MGPYRALLIAVTVLSFLSVAGMREIRASLVVAILFINAFGWGWELFNKWNKRRNQLADQGERELQVGNYSEAEKSLALAVTEANSSGFSAGKRATILRNLAEAQRKQSKFAEAERTIQQAITLLPDRGGQGGAAFGRDRDPARRHQPGQQAATKHQPVHFRPPCPPPCPP